MAKYIIAWEVKNPTWPVEAGDKLDQSWKEGGYQPPTWYVHTFATLKDAITYYAHIYPRLTEDKVEIIFAETKE